MSWYMNANGLPVETDGKIPKSGTPIDPPPENHIWSHEQRAWKKHYVSPEMVKELYEHLRGDMSEMVHDLLSGDAEKCKAHCQRLDNLKAAYEALIAQDPIPQDFWRARHWPNCEIEESLN